MKNKKSLYTGWNIVIKKQTVSRSNLNIVETEAQLIPITDKYMTTHFPSLVQEL